MVITPARVLRGRSPHPTIGTGFVHPFNRSAIATVVCVPLTSNERWAEAPGNVLLPSSSTGLRRDSVANVSQVIALDKSVLTERVSKLSRTTVELLLSGIDTVLGR